MIGVGGLGRAGLVSKFKGFLARWKSRVGVARLARFAGISNLIGGALGSRALPYVRQSTLKN